MSDTFTIPVIEPGVYRHYKGKTYEVMSIGCHTETEKYFVVYKPLYEHDGQPDVWIRPYDMFIETVVIDGVTSPRFTKIS